MNYIVLYTLRELIQEELYHTYPKDLVVIIIETKVLQG
jgi:hypothetical protein